MLRIGITGGIGSGKSVVARVFAALGVPVYDSDSRAKHVMASDLVLRAQLQEAFGADAYDAAGQLNRPYLARVAFNDAAQLARLNALVHPRVGEDFAGWAAAQAAAGAPYVLKEAALLYESGSYRGLDGIITVFAPAGVRAARVLRRDSHRSAADVEAIMSKQLSEDEKLARADYVVYNDDSQLVLPQVLALDARFRKAL
ncbi:dephospho-CoA kinase [Hymenobacter cheonanensis]|uniref:dephospho-CoA kinase n=1 Tax=Hymenobacter sp. CA2-7 TaxID=3063993 RepID=UPI0027141FE3|nr:dephospho-CoA kinase [Hymenobacter sp. CA2-7]MDO7884597.1 dephospho-CoA kinase [Hymenobacter sp. CA2-7]